VNNTAACAAQLATSALYFTFFNVQLQLSAARAQTKTSCSLFIACLHDQNKSGILEGRLLSNQSEQSEKFSKSPDWLKKANFLF